MIERDGGRADLGIASCLLGINTEIIQIVRAVLGSRATRGFLPDSRQHSSPS